MGKPGQKLARVGSRARDARANSSSYLKIIEKTFAANSVSPESLYAASIPLDHRRHFGQFFTPPAIADMMIYWAFSNRPRTFLDPAVGPGIFVRSVLAHDPQCETTAIDLDPVALHACKQSLGRNSNVRLVQNDFLNWDRDDRFDAIVANPPYLRHHDLHYDFDVFAEIGRRNQVRLSRLTNIYGLFILEICRRLTDKGRAAVIVPGEWLNANFGGPIKRFLLDRRLLHTLIYFSHAETVFADALTTASILFIEKNSQSENQTNLRTIFVTGNAGLRELTSVAGGSRPRDESIIEQHLPIGVLRQTDKWNHLLEHGPTEHDAGLVPLRTFATTRRGIATGANNFFHVRPSELREHGISARFALPCIGRAADVAGPVFSQTDFDALVKADRRTYLLSFADDLSDADRAYIEKGEKDGLPDRFLLAGRKPWYRTEQRPPADIWAAVFGRKGLRFVWNTAGVLNLTTFHCVYVNERYRNPAFIRALVACLNSPLIQNLARGNRRVYGGGLLKFEPRDLLDIPVPDLSVASAPTLAATRASRTRHTVQSSDREKPSQALETRPFHRAYNVWM